MKPSYLEIIDDVGQNAVEIDGTINIIRHWELYRREQNLQINTPSGILKKTWKQTARTVIYNLLKKRLFSTQTFLNTRNKHKSLIKDYFYIYIQRFTVFWTLFREASYCSGPWWIQRLRTVRSTENKSQGALIHKGDIFIDLLPIPKVQAMLKKRKCKQCKSWRMKRRAVKCCLLDLTSLLYTGTYGKYGYFPKTETT